LWNATIFKRSDMTSRIPDNVPASLISLPIGAGDMLPPSDPNDEDEEEEEDEDEDEEDKEEGPAVIREPDEITA
jgi:hypothetical protein